MQIISHKAFVRHSLTLNFIFQDDECLKTYAVEYLGNVRRKCQHWTFIMFPTPNSMLDYDQNQKTNMLENDHLHGGMWENAFYENEYSLV